MLLLVELLMIIRMLWNMLLMIIVNFISTYSMVFLLFHHALLLLSLYIYVLENAVQIIQK